MKYHAFPCQADQGATSVVQDEAGNVVARCDTEVAAILVQEALNLQANMNGGKILDVRDLATEAEYQAAVDEYASETIQIDSNAAVSRGDGGSWITAWVYIEVPDDATDEGEEGK